MLHSAKTWLLVVLPVLVVCALPVGTAVAVTAPDAPETSNWPAWRGPENSGSAAGATPPLVWSEEKNVRFKVEVPGGGLSSPVIWGDTLFLTSAVPTGREAAPPEGSPKAPLWMRGSARNPEEVLAFTLFAYDRHTGAPRWQRTAVEAVPHETTHGDGSWAGGSPVTDGEVVCAFFGSQGIYCYDLLGELLWGKDLGDMQTRNGFGEGASPALWGDTLVISWDHEGPSFIVALEKKTGRELWRRERNEITSWSTPVVVEVGGKPQVVVSATGRIRSYDLGSGELLWESGGMTANAIPTPVAGGGLLYATSGFRGNMLLAIRLAGARGDVTGSDAIAWSYDRDTPYVPSPLLLGGELYMIKHNRGILSALDARTGKVHYAERLGEIQGVYASPVGAAGKVYVVGRSGTTAVIKAGPVFEILAVNELADRFDASPALAGDTLYLRGHRYLYALRESPGEGK